MIARVTVPGVVKTSWLDTRCSLYGAGRAVLKNQLTLAKTDLDDSIVKGLVCEVLESRAP